MKVKGMVLAAVLGLAWQGQVSAQIYESKDAEGVPEFSDEPTVGAEVVELPATNLEQAPAPEAPDAPPEQASQPAPGAETAGGTGEQDATYIYGGGADDEHVRAQRREDEKRLERALPGDPGRPVAPEEHRVEGDIRR